MSTTITKPCPKCGSHDVVHKDRQMHNATHTAAHAGAHSLHGAVSGHPLMLMVVGGLWLGSKFIHTVSKPWRCEKCSHEFA